MTAQNQDTGGGFVLVHHSAHPAFAPLRLMNPVTYLGRQPGNDIVLDSTNVSRRHAKLIITDLGITAHDLDSHNGIFLNGKKVRSTPVTPGDLLYIGDICIEVRKSDEATPFHDGSHTAVVHSDVSDEDDPRARALAALMRIATLSAEEGSDWAPETIQLCRELVEAIIAAYVEVHDDGELTCPVVLQPDADRRSKEAPVAWPVIHQVVKTKVGIFSRDIVEDGIVDVEGAQGSRAVMAVPILVGAEARLASIIYLARGQATSGFSEVEFEALQAVARIVGLRLSLEHAPNEPTNVGDNSGAIAAQGKLIALEQRLVSAGEELSQSTTRIHELESENLTLKQHADLERQASTKREAERERDASAKAESALQQAKKDLAKELDAAKAQARAVAAKSADDQAALAAVQAKLDALQVQYEALQGANASEEAERIAQQAALEAQRQRADDAEAKGARLASDMAEMAASRTALEQRLTAAEAASAAAANSGRGEEALRTALRSSVLPMVVDHVEAVAAGEAPLTSAVARPVTVAYIALADFDAWCESASPEHVKAHLDAFCAAVASRTQANGGRIDQVIGHGHLVLFSADPSGARAAVRCALEVGAVVEADASDAGISNAPAVIAGLHAGAGVAGFFGDAEAMSYVEAGLPVVIARAAVDFAPKGPTGGARGVLVSDAVRTLLAGDVGFRVTRLDPSWIRGVNAPVQLALVDLDHGGDQ